MNQFDFFHRYGKAAEKLTLLLPDWITGNSEILKRKYQMKYGDRDFRQAIRQNKVHVMSIYMLIIALFLIAVLWSITDQLSERKEISTLRRPAFGKSAELFPVQVHMKYRGLTLTKEVTVKVKQKELTEEEKKELLKSCKDRLGRLMLGENKDSEHISKSLNLLDQDAETGTTINWTSSDPELISEKGEVNLIGVKDHPEVDLQAELTLDDLTETGEYRVIIDTEAAEEDYKRNMIGILKESLEQNNADASPVMILPGKLNGGIEVRWFTGKESHMVPLIVLFVFTLIIVYFKRYDRANKEIKEAEESLIRDLPEFINKLVLLLNAGLVVSTAFSKLVRDYELFGHSENDRSQNKRRYLYEELSEIQKRMSQSNTSLIKELTEFSKRCGVREMVRLTAVISDNWNKGSTLAEKLEGESELLWMARKKRAEEEGRLAETKLTLPLMILLIVLIMVTIAPAIMEM